MDPLNAPTDAPESATSRFIRPGEVVCAAKDLAEGGPGFRFTVTTADGHAPAFAIRYHGVVYAYLNRCAHQAVQLDWNEGDFFSLDKEFLVCATHGARYYPATGACAGGRCNGKGLTALPLRTRGQDIMLVE